MPLQNNVRSLTIVACRDPGLLTRICSVMTTAGVLPERMTSTVDDDRERVTITVELPDASDRQLDLMSRKLAQIVLVESVSASTALA